MLTTIFELSLVAVLPLLVSVLLYMLIKRTKFGKMSFFKQQLIIGILFGIMAIMGTEFGVDLNGVKANARDSAPLCAGLIFGAPAGLIAGFIGGIERWFATLWGAGDYTRLACTISTLLAGVIAAAMRKFLFENKKPSWFYAMCIGLVTEIIHMLMIFIIKINDAHNAFVVVQKCAIPMILVNGAAVTLAVLVITAIGKEKNEFSRNQKNITKIFQMGLIDCVLIAIIVTIGFLFFLQNGISTDEADNTLMQSISEVKKDISDASDENMLQITHDIADYVAENPESDYKDICDEFDVSEVSLIDKNGIIIKSSDDDFVGYDMKSGEQSAEFMVLLEDETEFVQAYQPISYDASISRKYAGVAVNGGFIQVGYDEECLQNDVGGYISMFTKNRCVGKEGHVIIADANLKIVSGSEENEAQHLEVSGIKSSMLKKENVRFNATVYGTKSYCMFAKSDNYYIIADMPESEALFSRDISLYVTIFLEIIVFVALFVLIYVLIKKLVVDNINKVNHSLSEITGGNLDVIVDVRSNKEFASLSDDINLTVATLKKYIEEAAARIDRELEFARAIQHSALPNVFPPYPNRNEFEIYASMATAKEVGGDFYDFYLLGRNHLAFLIADVSGKGIPAAMFMMTSKTLIKSLAETRAEVNEVFTKANEKLCENNDAGMFVTAWMGIINLQTGVVKFANAGHNPPLVRHKGGEFEYLKSRAGFVLAGMEGVNYRINELKLNPGDEIVLYTDGVTEATDASEELYGEERFKNCLDRMHNISLEKMCSEVKADVDKFVGDAPQFDDITMLALRYNGGGTPDEENEVCG